mmetsp:Transcript_9705/g.18510  ORF Transcript_9705/g.18510 Transcript_9705/m.18510 type:complete len:86 (+) Transcript_9705:289-546(+)
MVVNGQLTDYHLPLFRPLKKNPVCVENIQEITLRQNKIAISSLKTRFWAAQQLIHTNVCSSFVQRRCVQPEDVRDPFLASVQAQL